MNGQSENQKVVHLENEVRRLKSAVEELIVLNDLAVAAGKTLEVQDMLDIIVEKSIKAVKAEQGSILLVTEEKESPLKTLIRQADQRSRMMTYRVGSHITGWVLTYQQPLLIEDLATDQRFKATEQEKKEIRSVLCVPIRFQGRLIGILMVTNKKTLEPFTSDDMRLLSIIAAQSGQFIRNSRLQQENLEKKRMEQSLAMAQDIQLSLLPEKVPETKSLEIYSYFKPTDEVGGDYYDYFALGDEQIGVVIADVSGHGPSAALVMTMVKGILHSVTKKFQSPSQVLAEMNGILNDIAPSDMFVTMMFLFFDLKNKMVRYSTAGHNPLLFYDRNVGKCNLVDLRGPALGLTRLSAFKEKDIPLEAGNLLFIYTDGVNEAANEKMEMFEYSRLIQSVEEVSSKQAKEVIEHVKGKLHEFTGKAPQSDDVAMIAIRVLSPESNS
jgi:sigma-B regulation protein RsbU (phosphoserine phosphatase)